MPAKQELTVMPADLPSERMVGFTINEVNGSPVRRSLTANETVDSSEDLEVGDVIYFSYFTASASCVATVTEKNKYARSMGVGFILSREDDCRGKIWSCVGAVNLKNTIGLDDG